MKIFASIFLILLFLVCLVQIGFSQDEPVEKEDPLPQYDAFSFLDDPVGTTRTFEGGSPFSQGMWNWRLRNTVKYQTFKIDDQTDNNLGVDLMVRYFVANGFGIGLDLGYDNQSTEDGSGTDKTSGYSLMGGLAYGHSFGNFNLLLEGWAGISQEKETYSYTGGSTEQITDGFKYKVALGSPIRVGERPVYFTPRIGYSSLMETDPDVSDYEATRSGLFFDVKVDFYMGCEEMFCGYKGAGDDFDGWNRQGSNQIVVPTWARFNTGKQVQKYTGDGGFESKDSFTNFRFAIADYYYVVDNLAIGLMGSVENNVTKQDDSDYKSTNFAYTVMPMLRFNIPVDGCFNNVFIEGGYGIGSNESKVESGGTTISESTFNLSNYKAGIGYNLFLHYNFALTLGVNYNGVTIKDENDNKLESTGIIGTIGSTFAF